MSVKIKLALGLLVSVLALPQVLSESVGTGVSANNSEAGQQQLNSLDSDLFQTQPTCDPVNDPSSCRSS